MVLLFYAFCALPFVMLGIVCLAVVGKVREGHYAKGLFGEPSKVEAPQPGVAVVLTTAPFYFVLFHGLATKQLGWIGSFALLLILGVLSFYIYSAASKRRALSGSQQEPDKN